MRRVVAFVLLAACGGHSDAGAFEQAVVTANMELDRCWSGEDLPRADFPYTESAALSACRACWIERQANRVFCSAEADLACDEVLSFGRCACVWRTSAADDRACRECLVDACGVEAITDESAACAIEHCDAPNVCAFIADCGLRRNP